jgi:hypothetical protein
MSVSRITTGYGLDDQGSILDRGSDFLFDATSKTVLTSNQSRT